MKQKTSVSRLDEMQERRMSAIEKTAGNIAFWGLLAAIVIQLVINPSIKEVLGEIIVLAAMSIYLAAAAVKNGLWSYVGSPGTRTNALYSLIPALGYGIFASVRAFAIIRLPLNAEHVLRIIIMMICIYVICLIVLEIMRVVYAKRRSKLDAAGDEDDKKE